MKAKFASSSLPTTFLLALFALLPMASAHDHSSSHIEEGQTISVDPIVSSGLDKVGRHVAEAPELTNRIGHDIMGSYLHSNVRLGRYIPPGNGARGMYLVLDIAFAQQLKV